MKTDARLKKLPAPKEIVLLKKNSAAVCPNCDAWVTLKSRKKDKTHSGIEYVRHWDTFHNQLEVFEKI